MNLTLALRSLGAGAVTGMRSTLGPTLATRGTTFGKYAPLAVLGELIADKLPIVPARTMPASLLFRAVGGGFAGGSLARAAGESSAFGAALGVAGALGMSFACVEYRKAASRIIPSFVAALVEDMAAIALARSIAMSS